VQILTARSEKSPTKAKGFQTVLKPRHSQFFTFLKGNVIIQKIPDDSRSMFHLIDVANRNIWRGLAEHHDTGNESLRLAQIWCLFNEIIVINKEEWMIAACIEGKGFLYTVY